MKKKIKTWLIHLLGGVTVEESQESDKKSAYFGAYTTMKSRSMPIDNTASLLTNGASWCTSRFANN